MNTCFRAIVGIVLSVAVVLPAGAVSSVAAKASLTFENAKLVATEKNIVIRKDNQPIIKLDQIVFNYHALSSWTIVEASNTQILLRGFLPASAEFFRTAFDNNQRSVDITISLVDGGFRFYAQPAWGTQVSLNFDHLGDHFFGLSAPLQPNNQLSPDLTGAVIDVDINSEGNALRENFATAYSAFYMSSFGYGAFFDTFARGRYSFAINGNNQVHHDTGTLDWYVFIGNDGVDIHRAYYSLIGAPKKVPAWGLGPIGWRDHNTGAAEIVNDIEKLSALKIPFTSWFVDRPYSDGAHAWSELNFSQAFADPQSWIKKIRDDYGMEFMTWVATSTFGDTRFEKHLAGEFSYIDLSHQPSVKAYQHDLQKKQHQYGVKGHKIDRADEGFPVYEAWHDGTEAVERRNKYAFLMAQAHDEILQDTWGEDQITFARTAIHRTQPYLSAIWGGDPRTTWEGLQSNFANAMRSSFIGFPVWGTDVGGYQGEGYIPEDLYLRWMQAGSMTGLFEIKLDGAGGEGRDRMPWQYDEQFQARFRAICEDRMMLIPYLYSLASTSVQTGTLMQPMAYRHLDDKATYALWDQFYLGDAILVAPVFNSELSRSVYLPKGEWRDFDNPSIRYRGGKTVTIKADLDKLPRFVKANSLFVSGQVFQGNDKIWNDAKAALTIHAFPGDKTANTEFLYADLQDDSKIKTLTLSRHGRQVSVTAPAIAADVQIEVVLAKVPKAVALNGKAVDATYAADRQTLTVGVPANEPVSLVINL